MTTQRDLRNTADFWRSRISALEQSYRDLQLKGDGVSLAQCAAELRAARASRKLALQELSLHGIHIGSVKITHTPMPPRRRSVPSRATARSSLVLKSIDAERREITGWATTPEVDHIGDIVEPTGAVFKLPLPLLHQHQHDRPVGVVTDAKVTAAGISIKAKLAKVDEPAALRERVEIAWAEIKHGLVNGLSIGFAPLECSFLEDKSGGIRYSKWSWIELSLVTIPANASARISVAA